MLVPNHDRNILGGSTSFYSYEGNILQELEDVIQDPRYAYFIVFYNIMSTIVYLHSLLREGHYSLLVHSALS